MGQFSQEVSDERAWAGALLACRSRGELAAELGALMRALEDRFASREAPGGFIEQALARTPEDTRALQLGDAQRAAWDALRQAMARLRCDSDDDAGIGDVEERLRQLADAEDALLGLREPDAEPWS